MPVAEPEPVRVASSSKDTGVTLHRLVVPMTDDVVVRTVEKNTSPRIVAVRDDMAKMTPAQLRNAFRKTFLSENKHLSTYSIDDAFDVAEYAIPAMQWACGSGMIQGMEKNGAMYLDPYGYASRSQSAMMIYRFCTEFINK